MRLTSLLAAAGFALLPCVANAQAAPPAVPAGTRIFVTPTAGGQVVEGSLLTLSADSVALVVDGVPRTFPFDDVQRIERLGDPSRDGALRGALIGAVCIVTCAQGARNGRHLAQLVFVNGAFGALFGWWLDRDHVGRSRIYPFKQDWRDAAFPR